MTKEYEDKSGWHKIYYEKRKKTKKYKEYHKKYQKEYYAKNRDEILRKIREKYYIDKEWNK